jgi:hypothetical protein
MTDATRLDLDAHLLGAGAGISRSMSSKGPVGWLTRTTRIFDILFLGSYSLLSAYTIGEVFISIVTQRTPRNFRCGANYRAAGSHHIGGGRITPALSANRKENLKTPSLTNAPYALPAA